MPAIQTVGRHFMNFSCMLVHCIIYLLMLSVAHYTGCSVTMSVLQEPTPEVIPSQKCKWTCIWFSTVMELWIEIKGDLNDTKHDYRCTYSMTGHPTFQLTGAGVPEWADPWLMDLSWLSAELATAVTGPHSPLRFVCMGLHEKHGVWMQSKWKRGTTSSNVQCCKMHEWP
jgi:hypothetical protein